MPFYAMLLILCAWTTMSALDDIPPGGRVLVAMEALTSGAATFSGAEYGSCTIVPVQDMPFATALHVETTKQPVKAYHISQRLVLPAMNKGDAVLVTFQARSLSGGDGDTGSGQLNVVLQDKSDWSTIGRYTATPGTVWQTYRIPIAVSRDLPEGRSLLGLSFGAWLQVVEVGGLEVRNYGTDITVDQLPQTRITYDGREAGAAWREAAEQRIQRVRTNDIQVRVVDAVGKPVPGASVAVHMRRHAFRFGAAITSRCWEDSPQARPILENHAKLFNQGLPITYFVWSVLETSDGKQGAGRILDWMRGNGMATRAHALVWERLNVMPNDVGALIAAGDKAALHARVAEHIRSTIAAYKGRVDEWVVENEAVDNSELRKVLGEASIADWFKIAREADPAARLMINENRVEGLGPDKSDRLLGLVHTIETNGGKVDTIGIQGHVASVPVPPETLLRNYDKLAATGKKLAITEFDFETLDEDLRADYTRDVLIAVFSHASFDDFTFWRFWDGRETKHQSPIFANDWTLRRSGEMYQDLVFKRWWTDVGGTTTAAGTFATRGFLGDYEVTAMAGGKQVTTRATVMAGKPGVVELRLP